LRKRIALAFAQAHDETPRGRIDVVKVELVGFGVTNAGLAEVLNVQWKIWVVLT
jgi:hypothetical protein